MEYKYKVDTFVPKVSGCGAQDSGWNSDRCKEYQGFLNTNANDGWRLHSCEYREVSVKSGCGGNSGAWLVCVFEKER